MSNSSDERRLEQYLAWLARHSPAPKPLASLDFKSEPDQPETGGTALRLLGLDAIVFAEERPVYLVGEAASASADPRAMGLCEDGEWTRAVREAVHATGRIETHGSGSISYSGTCFVVGPRRLLTNRHVVETFTKLEDGRVVIRPRLSVRVSFSREVPDAAGVSYPITRVVGVHPKWDAAILEYEGPDLPFLRLRATEMGSGSSIFVVGHPARVDGRPFEQPIFLQDIVFRGVYDVKRIQPGRTMGLYSWDGCDYLQHDASTLGGNSGSAVVDAQSGEVVGLHSAGTTKVANYAVPAWALLADGWLEQPSVPALEPGATGIVTTAPMTSPGGEPPSTSTAGEAPLAPPPASAAYAMPPLTLAFMFIECASELGMDPPGLIGDALQDLGYLGWSVDETPARLPSAQRRGFEVAPPARVALEPRDAWVLAHALLGQLREAPSGGESWVAIEPVFAGDVAPAVRPALESTSGDRHTSDDVTWHLDATGTTAAHGYLKSQGIELGKGVYIAQPDTGYTEHPEIFVAANSPPLALDRAYDHLGMDEDPTDPRESGLLLQPGHGTATASVIVAQEGVAVPRAGTSAVNLRGVAPDAWLVPIRVTKSVIILCWQGRLADAIERAVDQGCQVISVSLGGLGGRRLEWALEYAESKDVIVVAAAGNVYPRVVAPARYPTVVACAASGPTGRPWEDSARGVEVNITAPGESVWVAGWLEKVAIARAGDGTSFSAAMVAGAAALWLSAHQAELPAYKGHVARAFRACLRHTASPSAHLPSAEFGAGLLDVDRLVRTRPSTVVPMPSQRRSVDGPRLEGPPEVPWSGVEAERRFLSEVLGYTGVDPAEHERASRVLASPPLKKRLRTHGAAERVPAAPVVSAVTGAPSSSPPPPPQRTDEPSRPSVSLAPTSVTLRIALRVRVKDTPR